MRFYLKREILGSILRMMESCNIQEYSKPSMKKLVPLMVDMAANWYELGAILLEEKQEAQLKIIESTHGSNVKKCCSAMLRYWIDKHPEATWHQLVTALRSPGVDLDAVASSIERNFSFDSTDTGIQSPTPIEFAECKSVTEAFAALMRIFIEELRKADFEALKIICQPRADRELKSKISKTTSIYSFFELLNDNPLYFNWMNVEYLDTMASAAGNTRLQGVLRDYTNVVLLKTLGQIWDSLPSFQKTRTRYYDKVRAEFRGQNPDNIKVQDLQNCKPKLAGKIAMHIMQIDKGSLTITWCILAEETYQAYLLALGIPQDQRNEDFLQIGTWVVFHPQSVIQELKKSYTMMTPQALLMSYYHDLLLSSLDADSLIELMCSDGLLTGQEQAIISSGHSVHQRNVMLLEYTRHVDIQAVKSFCELVQELWPQIGSQLIIALESKAITAESVVVTSEGTDRNMEVADHETRSSITNINDVNTCYDTLPVNVYFLSCINQIAKLLRFHQLKLVQLCETLKASDVHSINLFSPSQIKELNECNNTVLLFVKLSPLITWSNHSILRVLTSCYCEAVTLLDEFESRLNPLQLITSYPVLNLFSDMIPSDTSTYTILAVRCDKELYKCTLQYVYDVQSVMIEKCDITQHCLQLLAVRSDPTILYWTIPKCVVDLIDTNVQLHSEYLYSRGILEVLVYPDLLLTTGDDVCYGALAFQYESQLLSEKIADLAIANQKNEVMLKHVRSKYNDLLSDYDKNKKYTATLEEALESLKSKEEEKDISNDKHSQKMQESQNAISEVTDKEKPNVEPTMELELLKKQRYIDDLSKENEELKIVRNQLHKEVDEKNSSVKVQQLQVQQLQKQNKDLQQLVNKYKGMKHVDKVVNEAETVSISTQTDEKQPRVLCPGMKGAIVTCNGLERSCATEACRLLNEFADRFDQSCISEASSDATLDSDGAASQELKELKGKSFQRRFQLVECGVRNVVFIQCEEASICTSDLIHYMLSNIKTSGIPSTRYKHCQCILPVTHTCRAFQNDIIKCAREMLAPYFHVPDKILQYAIVYKSRSNSGIIKKNVITWIAETVNKGTTYNHKVNLDSPDLVILVEIIKSVCCMSVVKDFYKLKKYNIQELIMPPAEQQEGKT